MIRSYAPPSRLILLLALLGLCTAPACLPRLQPLPAPPSQPAATPVPTPTPAPSPKPSAVYTHQAINGRAVVRLYLGEFRPAPPLDYYVAGTLLWDDSPSHPALELSVRGTSARACLERPCAGDELGLVARYSADVAYDGTPGLSEAAMCGEGILSPHRLPLGVLAPDGSVDVAVDWAPGAVTVSTPVASWTAHRGAATPGFGRWVEGIPRPPKGIGWARAPWLLALHGGGAELVSWTGEPGSIEPCPPAGAE